jgi:hypothetical protein
MKFASIIISILTIQASPFVEGQENSDEECDTEIITCVDGLTSTSEGYYYFTLPFTLDLTVNADLNQLPYTYINYGIFSARGSSIQRTSLGWKKSSSDGATGGFSPQFCQTDDWNQCPVRGFTTLGSYDSNTDINVVMNYNGDTFTISVNGEELESTEVSPGGSLDSNINFCASTGGGSANWSGSIQVNSFEGKRDCPTTDPGVPVIAGTGGDPTIGGGAFGDPHFKTWNGKQFDFHGVCDLVLVSNLEFGNGIGLDVHIRTRKTRQWSYVDSAAARIGDDILEVRGGMSSMFWKNGIQGNVNTDEMVIANYQIKYQNISEKSKKFVVDLRDGEGIIFKTWNSFVSVQIENPKHKNFVGSVGLMGSFPKGLRIGRTNSIIEDFNVFGQEWQVLSTEQKLFHNIEDPQHPQKCEIPSSVEMRRRLAASLVTFDEAEKACVGADSENKELCIFDIMATNDLSSAGVY